MCERLHCLPNPGGLFQQEYSHVKKMEAVYRANDEMLNKRREARAQQFQNQSKRLEENES